jgi:hypothetical protein
VSASALGDVDAVAAQAEADLLLLEEQRLGAGGGVEATVEHGPRGLRDDADPLAGIHGGEG